MRSLPVAAPRTSVAFALAIAVFGFGALAVVLGQTSSWDLRNYHLYDGWAFWTGRVDRDFAVAQAQTYFNPLLATGTYLLFTHTPPRLSAFILGCIQGLNVLPLYLLARHLLPDVLQARHRWIALLVALIGTLGVSQLSELGASMGDNIVSVPLLTAFALIFCCPRVNATRAALAGVLAGLATGVKLTTAPFAAGLLLTLPLLATGAGARWRLLLAGGGAALAAFLATEGFWMLHLYRTFGDPMFPQLADFFGGEYAPPTSLRDTRFSPRNLLEWLFYPIVWTISPRRVSNAWFLDLRLPFAYAAMIILMVRNPAAPGLARERLLALAFAIGFALWLAVFSIYRYLAPLEMIAPLLICLALWRIGRERATGFIAGALVLLVLLVKPPGWGRLPEYSERFLEIDMPAKPDLARATIVFAEDEPLSFLALGLPESANLVRIGGNLLGPPAAAYGMDREAQRRLDASNGPFYALLADPRSQRTIATLARQRLALSGDCSKVRSNLLGGRHRAELCSLQRSDVLE